MINLCINIYIFVDGRQPKQSGQPKLRKPGKILSKIFSRAQTIPKKAASKIRYNISNIQGGYNENYQKQPRNQVKFWFLPLQNYYKSPDQMDPYAAQMLIYRAEMYILMKYPYLIELNINNAEISKTVNDKSFFYVIKSFSEEDVHKVKHYIYF